METKEYMEFIDWTKKSGKEFKPFTRIQAEFIEFLIKNKKDVNKLANLITPFELVTQYFRS